ncbi:unnamed protein product [Trifolium pratense]|uniref:Uncharacterized protein n=1 Tax=Trifolium pratense TaxID=57577 RepID=A0ACB0IY46_TRIPR|nr:unnamed protein product [Trifolium pratense]
MFFSPLCLQREVPNTLFKPVTQHCVKTEDAQTKTRIEETVLKILHELNIEEATKSKIRKQASIELYLNLYQPPFKALVSKCSKLFL